MLLRVVALTSDPYRRLDWCTGLMTDEGYYIHNARNVALFGQARTDEFNNMLLSPLLHGVQVAVFAVFGAGVVQARLISVVFSLLTLLLFWAALRRAFGVRVALVGVLFLGLDHTFLLFNRMALMDTPATLPAVAAFYAFVRGMQAETPWSKRFWLAACGLLAGLTVVIRSLCVYMLPAPFLALRRARSRFGAFGAVVLGMCLCLALYTVLWYLPNRAELGHMNAYYRIEQIQPRSLHRLRINTIDVALLGDVYGTTSYLFRHTPVAFILALLGLAAAAIKRRGTPVGNDGQAVVRGPSPAANDPSFQTYLIAWLLSGWIVLAVSSYSPDRYFVSTYPALFALASISLWRLKESWSALWARGIVPAALRSGLAWLLTYHAVESVIHQGGVLPAAPTRGLLYGLPSVIALFAAGIVRILKRRPEIRFAPGFATPGRLVSLLLAGWLVIDVCWLAGWAFGMSYTQMSLSRWLSRNLPENSVLVGDVAPGVSIDSPFRAISVIPKLCNGREPVERYAGQPVCIVILDGRMKEKYWKKTYPSLVSEDHLVRRAHVLNWDVGIYSGVPRMIQAKAGQMKSRVNTVRTSESD